jgi:hypothetical protein
MINAKIVIGRRSMLSDRDNETRSTIYEQSRGALELVPYDRLVDIEAATSSSQ